MAKRQHLYQAKITWTGNLGSGTSGYREYSRDHKIEIGTKRILQASSDPAFLGTPELHNPEELFLASLSSCHMLWFLHLCSVEGIVITDYSDEAVGTMIEEKDGQGSFKEVTLYPRVTVKEERMVSKVDSIHSKANQMCFIANSVKFPIRHISKIYIKKNHGRSNL